MWVRWMGLGVMGVVGLVACGDTKSDDSKDGAAGATSSTGGGGSAGASNTSGSAGTNSAGASAAGASGAGGSASGGGPAAPTSVPELGCAYGEVVYEGSVGGKPLQERLSLSGPAAGYWRMGAFSGGISSMALDGTKVGDADRLPGGVLVFPQGSARAGEIWCIDEGSLMSESSGAFIGHPLGRCPGAAVTGTLHTCTDAGQSYCDDEGVVEKRSLGGELGGKPLESPGEGLTSVTPQAWAMGTALFDVLLFAASEPTTSNAGKVSGFLVATGKNPDFGDVYCVGDGEWKRYSDYLVLNANQATLSQITRVGSCKDAGPTEALNVCIGLR